MKLANTIFTLAVAALAFAASPSVAQVVGPDGKAIKLPVDEAVLKAVYNVAGNRLQLIRDQTSDDIADAIANATVAPDAGEPGPSRPLILNTPHFGQASFLASVKRAGVTDEMLADGSQIKGLSNGQVLLSLSIGHPFINPQPPGLPPFDPKSPDDPHGFFWGSPYNGSQPTMWGSGGADGGGRSGKAGAPALLVRSAPPYYPISAPLVKPPGTNFMPTIYTNLFDDRGKAMANTLPSTQRIPYNLHPTPATSNINPISPTDDLRLLFFLAIYKLSQSTEVADQLEADRKLKTKWEVALEAAERDGRDEIEKLERQLAPFNERNSLGVPEVSAIDRLIFTEDALDAIKFDYPEVYELATNVMGKSPPTVKQVQEWIENNAALGPQLVLPELDVDRIIDVVLAILEGRDVANRTYSGFPLLHYEGPNKIKTVAPIVEDGKVVGGNLGIRQIWYDSHVECDAALLNPYAVWDVPWTLTYTIDVLNRGEDDFSPFAMFTGDPANKDGLLPEQRKLVTQSPDEADKNQPPAGIVPPKGSGPGEWPNWPAGEFHVGMDQTFFPMENGKRYVFKMKMPPGKYFHLTYTWGWRWHPPRIQVTDRATKKFFGGSLSDWETDVFGDNPRGSEEATLKAISQIGDVSPSKRMWNAMRETKTDLANAAKLKDAKGKRKLMVKALRSFIQAYDAYEAWRDRTSLPKGIKPVDQADVTLLYCNNTIYGEMANGWVREFPVWNTRFGGEIPSNRQENPEFPYPYGSVDQQGRLKVGLINGDYFYHGYLNMDFGGHRGWENQFKSSVKVAGSGCWFTFGRAHYSPNTGTILIPPAKRPKHGRAGLAKSRLPMRPPDTKTRKNFAWQRTLDEAKNLTEIDGQSGLATRRVEIEFHFDPGRRLRFYQFDPLHHDVAIFSIH